MTWAASTLEQHAARGAATATDAGNVGGRYAEAPGQYPLGVEQSLDTFDLVAVALEQTARQFDDPRIAGLLAVDQQGLHGAFVVSLQRQINGCFRDARGVGQGLAQSLFDVGTVHGRAENHLVGRPIDGEPPCDLAADGLEFE